MLTLDQLIKIAPAVSNREPAAYLSKNYVQTPTIEIIEDIMSMGWQLSKIDKAPRGKDLFKKHGVTFKHPDLKIDITPSDTLYPQVTLLNSSDGQTSFKLFSGFFRVLCTNNLVIPHKILGHEDVTNSLRVRHVSYRVEDLRADIQKTLIELEQAVNHIHDLTNYTFNVDQIHEFASRSFLRRQKVKEDQIPALVNTVSKEVVQMLTAPRRVEDASSSAWHVWNTVEENLLEKGFIAPHLVSGEMVSYKPITGFDERIRLSKGFIKDLNTLIEN